MSFQQFLDSLPEVNRESILSASSQRWAQDGHAIITQGDASDAVFVIEDGVVSVSLEAPDEKISRPLTYLGRGDIFGELGVIIRVDRTATVTAVCDVYYRVFKASVFWDMMLNTPGFAAFIASRLASCVAHTTSNLAYNSLCTDLSGKLPQFDMISVFYTVAGSGSTGELKVLNDQKDTIGTFFFEQGRLRHAHFKHLRGVEACRQLFIEYEIAGAFSYKRVEKPSNPADELYPIDSDVEDIVFEGALLRDSFELLPDVFKQLQGTLTVMNFDPAKGSSDSLEARERIAQICSSGPLAAREVWSRSAVSLVGFGKACVEMQNHGQLDHTL